MPAAEFDLRVYALNPQSMRCLDWGIWPRLAPGALAPVQEMLVFGDDGSSKLEFSAYRAASSSLRQSWRIQSSAGAEPDLSMGRQISRC
jgi:2-polyprenyl-6-methoxyphenol hydroxylase-like FAD-dependent oxidoreductase